jgi:phospholipid/cholesterol/gamma-HCH transport system permease protein
MVADGSLGPPRAAGKGGVAARAVIAGRRCGFRRGIGSAIADAAGDHSSVFRPAPCKDTMPVAEAPASLEFADSPDGPVARPRGDWVVVNLHLIDEIVHARAGQAAILDVGGLGGIDTSGALLLGRLGTGPVVPVTGQHPTAARLVAEVMRRNCPEPPPAAERTGLHDVLERIGRSVVDLWRESLETLDFIGQVVFNIGKGVARPGTIRWVPTVAIAEAAGFNAIPIVMVLSFFIGAVVAFLGAGILETFGATIFTVELVGFSVMREFGALITAIILAGRSASAFTAQIGSMKMTQEIDAMRVIGLEPMGMLVVPRVLALMAMAPLLTFLAVLAGLGGGMLVSVLQLDISPQLFLSRLQENVGLQYFWAGLVKAPVFAALIAVIGCRKGLEVGSDVISLGRNTTSAVVQSIFMVIVVNAVFAMIYLELDL